jgi:hypothetical protein
MMAATATKAATVLLALAALAPPPPAATLFPENKAVDRCVSGFCLTSDYEKLEAPPTSPSDVIVVEIMTDIMDVLTVIKTLFISFKQN